MVAINKRQKYRDGMLKVESPDDIEYLVKECEVVRGKPGRDFVISSADRLTYRVASTAIGYQIQRLDAFGNSTWTQDMHPGDFMLHSLGEATSAGQLFTSSCGSGERYPRVA